MTHSDQNLGLLAEAQPTMCPLAKIHVAQIMPAASPTIVSVQVQKTSVPSLSMLPASHHFGLVLPSCHSPSHHKRPQSAR
jgi:hypothetical protein